MTLTPSTMMPLGSTAPDFELPDVVSGKNVSLATFKSKKALLILFICRHCPYVRHLQGDLAQIGLDYRFKDIGIIAISSNDAQSHPEDSPESLKEMAAALGFTFPFCYDETQQVAKNYHAACTPDFFLFDKKRTLVYRGQFDDSRPDSGRPVTGRDLRQAIDAALADEPVSRIQKPSMGCNIKWKPGNEPDYFKS
ncbi:MAG: thioredoxin family protein [Candidatus Omnitrophica bacterium]|nr:thioredoxin family protein [Candidatus Omnitrophota bacterium]